LLITIHISACSCFSDINISERSVAVPQCVWCMVGYLIITLSEIYC